MAAGETAEPRSVPPLHSPQDRLAEAIGLAHAIDLDQAVEARAHHAIRTARLVTGRDDASGQQRRRYAVALSRRDRLSGETDRQVCGGGAAQHQSTAPFGSFFSVIFAHSATP